MSFFDGNQTEKLIHTARRWSLFLFVCSLGSDWLIAAGAYPSFSNMKRLGVFLLPLNGMLVHRRSLPRNLLGLPIYTPGWREALCLGQEHNTVSPARARTRTARSGDERTNYI